MVARGFLNAPTLLTRSQGYRVGMFASAPPAALALLAFLGSYPGMAVTIAVACVGSRAVIGATIGRGLASKPDPLGVLLVAAIAMVVGDVLVLPVLALGDANGDPIGLFVGGLVVLGIPAHFFAFPGVVLGIWLARRSMPALLKRQARQR